MSLPIDDIQLVLLYIDEFTYRRVYTYYFGWSLFHDFEETIQDAEINDILLKRQADINFLLFRYLLELEFQVISEVMSLNVFHF